MFITKVAASVAIFAWLFGAFIGKVWGEPHPRIYNGADFIAGLLAIIGIIAVVVAAISYIWGW